MDLPYLMDTMFDLLNESDNLNFRTCRRSNPKEGFL